MDRTDRIVEDQLNAWASLIQAHSVLVGRLERDLLDQRSLPLSWYEVLLHLSRAPEGAMRMQDLSEAVLLSKSGMTRLIDRMEERGLVERIRVPDDRRVVLVRVSPEGARMRDEIEAIKQDQMRSILGNLDVDQLTRLVGAVGDLRGAVAQEIGDDHLKIHVHNI